MGVDYITSVFGILKIIEFICCLIGIIMMGISDLINKGKALLAACIVAIIITFILFILIVTDVAKYDKLPIVEAIIDLILFLFLLITGIFAVLVEDDYYIVGGVFAIVAAVVYIIQAILHLKQKK